MILEFSDQGHGSLSIGTRPRMNCSQTFLYLNSWKKPARQKYVEIADEPVDPSQLKVTMIKVNQKTEI